MLERPNIDLVQEHIFARPEQVQLSDRALHKLFKQFPSNKNLDEVLLKVTALNTLYSTSIFGVHAVALHITTLDIDSRLRGGSIELVPLIANVTIGGRS